MKKFQLCLFLFICFSPGVSNAQSTRADSLKQQLLKATHDTTRATLLSSLAEAESEEGVWQKYNSEALALAEKNIPGAKGKERRAFLRVKAAALNNGGYDKETKGDLSTALIYYSESLKIEEELQDEVSIAIVLNNIADIYETQGYVSRALDYYSRSLKLNEKRNNKIGIAQAYNNIGFIYSNQGDLDKALEFYQKSYKIKKELNNKQGLALSLSNIGYILQKKKSFFKAMSYYLLALKSATEIKDKELMSQIHTNIGGILQLQGDEEMAIKNFRTGLRLSQDVGDKDGLAHHSNSLGKIYLSKGLPDSALYFGTRSMDYAKEIGSPLLISHAAELLKDSYKAKGNAAKALEYFELYFKMNDSISNEETKKATYKQQLTYEYDKKETLAKAEQEKKDVENASAIKRQRILTWSIGIGLLMVIIFSVFLYKRFLLTQKQKKIIEEQKMIVDEKNTEILDSITYAKRLQDAILPPLKDVKEQFPHSFILFKPKDIVAGDFYWFEQLHELTLFAAADCTGHGVPGAMVSVVCSNALNRAVKEFKITEPGKILDKVRELVVETFQKSESDVKDGMDISLCSYNKKTNQLQWAGANNPLWLIRNSELTEYKANKQPIGKTDNPAPFTTHTLQMQNKDSIFLFTDGYADQFGGPKGKKFKYAAFKEILLSIQELPAEEQLNELNTVIQNWKGKLEQVDDILVIGVNRIESWDTE